MTVTPREPQVAGSAPLSVFVSYASPLLPLYSTTRQPVRSVPAGPATSMASPVSVPALS